MKHIKTYLENVYRFIKAIIQLGYVGVQIIPLDRELEDLNVAVKSNIIGSNEDAELNGGINPGDQKYLAGLLSHLKPISVLEIGTHVGFSTKIIVDTLSNNTSASVDVSTVDIVDVNAADGPWLQLGESLSPRDRIKCGQNIKLNFIKSDSVEFLRSSKDKFDFVFLDGSHEGRKIYDELNTLKNHVNPGSIVLIHDYFPGRKALWSNRKVIFGPVMACEKLFSEGKLRSVVPVGKLPVQTKWSSCMTSLALVELK